MPVTSGLSDVIRQLAAEAMAPAGASIKAILVKVGATGTYGPAYNTAYVVGLGGDEVATGNGYTQGGQALATRTAGVISGSYGWVDYADASWTVAAGQTLSAIACGFWDSTNSRWLGWVDFGGTLTVAVPSGGSPSAFTVQCPGDGGTGTFRV